MEYYDYEEKTNKIPYDKEPIHRQSNYQKAKTTSIKSGSKLTALFVCLMLLVNVVLGIVLVKVLKKDDNGVNNTIISIESPASIDVALVASKAKKSAVCVNAGLTKGSTESPDYQGFFKMASNGSGVIFRDDKTAGTAYVLTCFHVVRGLTNQIYVLLHDSYIPIKASLVYFSSIYDIAVVKISASSEYINSSSVPAEIADSSLVIEGDRVVAIGNPMGAGFSVTDGIVSKTTDLVDVDGVTHRVMRTDAPINAGNSGGGLFNDKGELIGLVSAKTTDNVSKNEYIDCVAYAIPSNVAFSIAENIVRNRMPVKAVLGVEMMVYDDPSDSIPGITYNIINGKYVPVQNVVISKATKEFKMYDKIVGFSYGDTVVNMVSVYSFDDHAFNISKGDVVKFFVERDGKQITISVKITEEVSADADDWYKA